MKDLGRIAGLVTKGPGEEKRGRTGGTVEGAERPRMSEANSELPSYLELRDAKEIVNKGGGGEKW